MIDVRVTKIEKQDDPNLCEGCDSPTEAVALVGITTARFKDDDHRNLRTHTTYTRLCTDCVLKLTVNMDIAVDSFMEGHGRRKRR